MTRSSRTKKTIKPILPPSDSPEESITSNESTQFKTLVGCHNQQQRTKKKPKKEQYLVQFVIYFLHVLHVYVLDLEK